MLPVTLVVLTWCVFVLMMLSAPPSLTLLGFIAALVFLLMNLFTTNLVMPFYIWFEASLLPMAAIILGWGLQPERLSATTYMLFYTIFTALPFLSLLVFKTAFLFSSLVLTTEVGVTSFMTGLILMLPFLVKTPMYLLHLWLPKAHVEAPVYGSMVLAGVLLKIGGIGLLRMMPIIPFSAGLAVGVVSIVGGAVASLITLTQVDIKALIAYSSVVHMSMTTTCLLMGLSIGVSGSWLMLLGHGLCSSGLFYVATVNYSRVNTRSLVVAQGVLMITPGLALVWVVLILVNLSAPPSLTLLSEIVMSYNCFIISPVLLLGVGLVVVTVLVYSLQLYYNYYHGLPAWLHPIQHESIKEISVGAMHSSIWLLSPLVYYLLE